MRYIGEEIGFQFVSCFKRLCAFTQCQLDAEAKKLSIRMLFSAGVMTEVLIDSTGNGYADTRDVYEDGTRVRSEVDTNDDRSPDVIQALGPGGVPRQDEDTDFDGLVDLRFDGEELVEVPAGTKVGAKFGKIGCGSFHRFWWKR